MEDKAMPFRPVVSVIRWSLLGGGLITIGSTATIDFVQRWPKTAILVPLDPVSLVVKTTNIVISSPLLLGISIFVALLIAACALKWVIGPKGLATPE